MAKNSRFIFQLWTNMNFSIIVQARSTSTRFSNKIMAEIDGKPIILHVINACMQAGYEPIFCIPKNDNVKQWLISKGLIFHEGSEHNVLERYYQTACKFEIKNIMRITCDCPLINSETINYLAWHHLKFGSSFTSNCINKSIDGQDIDIMTFKCLELAYKNATQEYDKEHVTTYIKRCIRDNEFPGFPEDR